MLNAARQGDYGAARAAMERLLPLMRNLESGGYTQKVKRGCELLGFAVGAPRRPLLPLPAADREEFERILKNS